MAHLLALKAKQVRQYAEILNEQFGASFDTNELWYFHEKKKDIFLLNKEFLDVNIETLRINNMGLYVANLDNQDEIRLSIEGSQLLGPMATKNVVELTPQQARQWIKGEEIPIEGINGYVIIKSGSDYMGCGRIKENVLLNFVPKGRRIKCAD